LEGRYGGDFCSPAARFSIGQGTSMQQPLAIAIVSGLMIQFPLILIVLPAILLLLGARPAEAREPIS
jgi:Cu/Ag efflux pump CusA